MFAHLAREHSLLAIGGSDYHGDRDLWWRPEFQASPLPALLGAVELGAAAVALTGRQLRVCGVLLFVVAAMGASHVVLSAAYMKV